MLSNETKRQIYDIYGKQVVRGSLLIYQQQTGDMSSDELGYVLNSLVTAWPLRLSPHLTLRVSMGVFSGSCCWLRGGRPSA